MPVQQFRIGGEKGVPRDLGLLFWDYSGAMDIFYTTTLRMHWNAVFSAHARSSGFDGGRLQDRKTWSRSFPAVI